MIEARTSPRTATAADGHDRLNDLVDRIAARDRAAFRCLFAFLAMPIWREAVRTLPDPRDAPAVTRSTFVEVWHLAGHHVNSPIATRAWIAAITARQVHDRLGASNASGPFLGDHDAHVHRELAALLGAGQATIRISPATFVRVDDLDLDFRQLTAGATTNTLLGGVG